MCLFKFKKKMIRDEDECVWLNFKRIRDKNIENF